MVSIVVYFNQMCVNFRKIMHDTLKNEKIISQIVGISKSATKLVTGCLQTTKVVIFVVIDLKKCLAKYEIMGLCLCVKVRIIRICGGKCREFSLSAFSNLKTEFAHT